MFDFTLPCIPSALELMVSYKKRKKEINYLKLDRSVGLQKETREVVTGPGGVLAGHTEHLQSVAIALCSR